MAELVRRLRKLDQDLYKNWDISVISRIESGERHVRAVELRGLAIALECRVADIVDEVDE